MDFCFLGRFDLFSNFIHDFSVCLVLSILSLDVLLDFVLKHPIIKNMKQELIDAVKSVIDSLGFEIYHIEFNKNVLKVLIESGDSPVTIEACVHAARMLSAKLDSVDMIPYHYRLEVSSPGIERALFIPNHYKRFIGHDCHLITKQGFVLGKLMEVNDELVKLEKIEGIDSKMDSNQNATSSLITIPYTEIKSGKLKVSDDSLFCRRHKSNDKIEKDSKEMYEQGNY